MAMEEKNNSPETSRPSAAGPRSRRAKPQPDLGQEVVRRLGFLRQAARESGHNYVLNLEHDLIKLMEAVKDMGGSGEGPSPKQRRQLEKARQLLDEIKLKPDKGRRKDLKRIEQAIEALADLLVKKK